MYAAAVGRGDGSRSPLASGHALPAADFDSDLGSDDDQDGMPGSKRKRPTSVSCELCKQRKVKCDRGQPSCGWCTRNGASCEYKERKKPGLRAGYGRELEQRLDRLEEVLRTHSQILQTSYGPNAVPAPPSRSNPSEQGTPREITTAFRPSEPMRTPQQADQATFAAAASQFSGSPGSTLVFAQQQQQQQLSQGQGQMDQDLPPYDMLYSLVDIYFQHINTWCPILFKKTTVARLFGNGGGNQMDEADRILLHAIVATSMRYSTDARLTEDRREHYHRTSKQKVLLYGMENSSVTSLQALVILALDICGSANGPPGWNIMALITRSVVQLGLAVESNSFMVAPKYTSIYTLRAMVLPEPHDFAEDESRRRLFWMVYLLDRYATISTAFEFALDSKEIDRRLPCHDDYLNANSRVETRWFDSSDDASTIHDEHHQQQDGAAGGILGALAYYVEILGLLSKIHRFLKQPVNISDAADVERWQSRYKELDTMLGSWHYALPPEYGKLAQLLASAHAKDKAILVMLHATFNTAVIRLHSSAAYPTTRSAIFTPSYRASQRCLSAVENIATIGDFVKKHGLLAQLGPPFAFTLWVAARLLLVHGSTVERKLSTQIGFFVDSLRELGAYWPVAARYCGVLQRVLDEHRESEQTGDGVTPNSVAILADMRRTAFDLEFLISRQPRHGGAAMQLQQPIKTAMATPARTPGPNELEYLDVFDFFNVPRLPVGGELAPQGMDGLQGGGPGMDQQQQQAMPNEFNITNFMMDANSDWLFKQESGKFMTHA